MPDPCQNEQSWRVRSGHLRGPISPAVLGQGRPMREPIRPPKQSITGPRTCPRYAPGRPSTANDQPQQHSANTDVRLSVGERGGVRNRLVMRRSGVRFPKAAQFKGLISIVRSVAVAWQTRPRAPRVTTLHRRRRSRRVRSGGSGRAAHVAPGLLSEGDHPQRCHDPFARRADCFRTCRLPEIGRRPVAPAAYAKLHRPGSDRASGADVHSVCR